ncbi:MAG: site-specific DNA-methyltransferase [Caldilineaceae bacterium]
MLQLSLPIELLDAAIEQKQVAIHSFSHNGTCGESERFALENKYANLLEETHKFSRRIVSFQANKIETLHNWFKYREGFSAQLVEILLSEFGIDRTKSVLDPFAGSCTTLLEAKLNGINAVGIELLPHCHLAWEAKSNVFDYNIDELSFIRDLIQKQEPPVTATPFPHLTITESAFPSKTERAIVDYKLWFESLAVSEETKLLCRAALMSLLEEVSYTRKDGQYLRWDGRATKLINRNETRIALGKEPVHGIDKGELPTVRQALLLKFDAIIRDIYELQQQPPPTSQQQLFKGSSLYILPQMSSNQFDAVITSPPYANRYDYTRTYALELAYLSVDQDIFGLRQGLLSCTVENRSKATDLEAHYSLLGRTNDYRQITEIIRNNSVLREVNIALSTRNDRNEINNRGVLKMIEQYFAELTFIYSELYRVCRSGAHVAFVNDNVRYAGEVIPVDLISTNLAEQIGFTPVKVYVLPQRKGNSSQQMGKFGRQELRKSITIWRK